MVMDFLKGIGQVIQAPMHAVQTPIGDMLQAVGATQQGGVEGFGERMRQPGSSPATSKLPVTPSIQSRRASTSLGR
jgi:hypothetical protein